MFIWKIKRKLLKVSLNFTVELNVRWWFYTIQLVTSDWNACTRHLVRQPIITYNSRGQFCLKKKSVFPFNDSNEIFPQTPILFRLLFQVLIIVINNSKLYHDYVVPGFWVWKLFMLWNLKPIMRLSWFFLFWNERLNRKIHWCLLYHDQDNTIKL